MGDTEDTSTNTTKSQITSGTCHVLHIGCHLSNVTNANRHSHDPPPANSPSMQGRMLLLILT